MLTLFAYGAMFAAIGSPSKDLRWSWWIFSSLALVGYTFILPGILFAQHAHVSPIPSILASREFLITLIAPTIYFLYRIGYSIDSLESVFLIVVSSLVFSYLFHYYRLDLKSAFFSSNPTIAGMVTWDEWRGYRLKPPGVALQFATLIAPYMIFKANRATHRVLWGATFAAVLWCWSILMARSTISMVVVGIALYFLWFHRKNRLGLFFLCLPLVAFGEGYFVFKWFSQISAVDDVRDKAYDIAFSVIAQYPFFGFGQSSAATLTDQELFWEKFFPSDIGIIGVAYRYGFIGVTLYISMLIFSIKRAISTNWLIQLHTGQSNIIFIAFASKGIGDLLKFVLSVDYIYIEGLLTAAFIIGLSSIYRHNYLITSTINKRTELP